MGVKRSKRKTNTSTKSSYTPSPSPNYRPHKMSKMSPAIPIGNALGKAHGNVLLEGTPRHMNNITNVPQNTPYNPIYPNLQQTVQTLQYSDQGGHLQT